MNIFEIFYLLDATICSCMFFLIDTSTKLNRGNNQNWDIKRVLYKYENLYILGFFDRMTFYLLIQLLLFNMRFEFHSIQVLFYTIFVLCIPAIQNRLIMQFYPFINKYIGNRNMFIRYNFSKFAISLIQNIDKDIVHISNYNIFILYQTISFDFINHILYNILFVFLFNLLRSIKSTYYYYKAVKWAYYTNTGYKYTVISRKESVDIINDIINNKNWKGLGNIEVVNAMFTIIRENLSSNETFTTTFLYNLYKFFSLWGAVSFIQKIPLPLILDLNIIITLNILFLAIYFQKFLILTICFCSCYLSINDLITTILVLSVGQISYLMNEFVFFVKNYKNIKSTLAYINKMRVNNV